MRHVEQLKASKDATLSCETPPCPSYIAEDPGIPLQVSPASPYDPRQAAKVSELMGFLQVSKAQLSREYGVSASCVRAWLAGTSKGPAALAAGAKALQWYEANKDAPSPIQCYEANEGTPLQLDAHNTFKESIPEIKKPGKAIAAPEVGMLTYACR